MNIKRKLKIHSLMPETFSLEESDLLEYIKGNFTNIKAVNIDNNKIRLKPIIKINFINIFDEIVFTTTNGLFYDQIYHEIFIDPKFINYPNIFDIINNLYDDKFDMYNTFICDKETRKRIQ